MRRLRFDGLPERPLHLLAIGAHPDDIEIGAGGTILRLAGDGLLASARWVVMSATGERANEARRSAEWFLGALPDQSVSVFGFRDGYLPYLGGEVKERFEELLDGPAPDLILTHRGDDAHQDHRLVAELTWNTFRENLILEYEVPKYDGDLGPVNVYIDLPDEVVSHKVAAVLNGFPSQHDRHWFTAETFRAIARLRGIECRAPSGFAEGFKARKLLI